MPLTNMLLWPAIVFFRVAATQRQRTIVSFGTYAPAATHARAVRACLGTRSWTALKRSRAARRFPTDFLALALERGAAVVGRATGGVGRAVR